jgi:type I restriction enzyme, S subunit
MPEEELAQGAILPEGWAITVLDEAGHWVTGGTPSRRFSQYFEGTIPWVKSGDLNDGIVSYTEEKITTDGLRDSAAKLLPIGTVSIALYGATIGKLGLLAIAAATNQACANCVPYSNLVDRRYLFLYLLRERHSLIEAGQGGAQPNLTNRIVRDWPFLLAPFLEQRCIVLTVDRLLALVDRSHARLNNVPRILKAFRQSVLAAACSGRLTEEWRESRHAPQWETIVLKNLLVGKPRNGLSVRAVQYETTVRSLTLTATTSGRFRPGHFKYLDLDIPQDSHLWLKNGDILLQRGNTEEYVGVAALYDGDDDAYIYPDLMIKIRPNDGVLSKYLWLALSTPEARQYFRANATGSQGSMPKINQTIVENARINVPSMDEQREIVRRVDALFGLADKIEERVALATKRADNLTQSILTKAFRGELVPAEAELARREGRDYEPASALLARIKAERESMPASNNLRKILPKRNGPKRLGAKMAP